jgi:peptidoglycan hydrolase CwlO-like protein
MNDDPNDTGGLIGRHVAWWPYQPKQIVKNTTYPLSEDEAFPLANDAMNQVTNYIGNLQNAIRELEVRLDDAQEEIADYIEMIDEKNKLIEDQAKFIDILQRQIAIAETYLVKRLDSTK